MTKKVLVLGGTGSIGVYLLPELLKKGYTVHVTSRQKRKPNNNLKFIRGNAHDLKFMNEVLSANKYDAIVDFMVYSTYEFRARYELLLRSCQHYIFLSSYRVFADTKVITEKSPRLLDSSKDKEYLKTDEYALAKARQEDILRGANKKNWTIVRPAITYSKERFQLGTMEANTFIWRALQNLPVIMPEEMLKKTTTMTWAGDVAELITELVFDKKAMTDDFNIATAEHHTWAEVVDMYKEILGLKVHSVSAGEYIQAMGGGFNKYQVAYDRMFNRVLDNSKVLRLTGKKQKDFVSLKNGFLRELNQFIKSPNFGAIDYTTQARLDKLTRSRVDLSEASSEEKRAYQEVRYPRKIKFRQHLRPRTRLKAVKQKLRSRTHLRKIRQHLDYKSEWKKYSKYDGVVITLSGYHNYGNIIQRFALPEFLRKHGYNFVSYEHSLPNAHDPKAKHYRFTAEFVEKYIKAKSFDTRDKFPAYIVGSDQIWRNWSYKDINRGLGFFFLNFVSDPKAKKIAYAASFGKENLKTASITSEFVEYAKPLINQFDAVSLREVSGINLVKKTWGVKAKHVIDPTMLLTARDYSQIVESFPRKLETIKPIFTYFIVTNEPKETLLKNIKSSTKKNAWGLLSVQPEVLAPVEQWLKGFRDAELVITDSFHGTVFSIINNTPFVVVENETGGVARIIAILKQFGLDDRLVRAKDVNNFDITKLKTIDWRTVNQKLLTLRDDSSKWLLKSLEFKKK